MKSVKSSHRKDNEYIYATHTFTHLKISKNNLLYTTGNTAISLFVLLIGKPLLLSLRLV